MWRFFALAALGVFTLGFGVVLTQWHDAEDDPPLIMIEKMPPEGLQQYIVEAPAAPAFPQIVIRQPVKQGEKQVKKILKLGQLEVEATVIGGMSKTRLIMRFDNELDRILEGELIFPLPEGAVVTGYGLDINGTLVEASTVEKHKARIAMEKEIRKGIDPGMVEYVTGNNYRTRVYPIPAKGSRTVMIEYQMPLLDDHYVFNLKLPNKLELMELELNVLGEFTESPKLEGAADLKLKKHADGYMMHFAREEYQPDLNLKLALPTLGDQPRVLVESYKPKGDWKTGHYFLVEHRSQPLATEAKKILPRRIGVAWDVSLSRQFTDLTSELELLKAQLDQLLVKQDSISVEVMTFSDTVVETKHVVVEQGKTEDLINWLKSRTFDGGTNLGALNLNNDSFSGVGVPQRMAKLEYWLLFTDGLGNLGDKQPKTSSTVYTITDAAKANHPLLKKIANASGGGYLNLRALKQQSALEQIGATNPWALRRVEYDPKQVSDLYPQELTPVNGVVRVSGQLITDEAEVTLVYGYGSDLVKEKILLKKEKAGDSGLVAKAWAGMRLAELMLDQQANDQAIMTLGKAFEMVTPRTSLMVLETLEQHLEHEIVPAKSREDMYAKYMEQIEQRKVAREKTKEQKLKQVVAMWSKQVAWWEKEFTYPKDFKYQQPNNKKSAARTQPGGNEVSTGFSLSDSVARPQRGRSQEGQQGQPGAQGGQTQQHLSPQNSFTEQSRPEPSSTPAEESDLPTVPSDARMANTPTVRRGSPLSDVASGETDRDSAVDRSFSRRSLSTEGAEGETSRFGGSGAVSEDATRQANEAEIQKLKAEIEQLKLDMRKMNVTLTEVRGKDEVKAMEIEKLLESTDGKFSAKRVRVQQLEREMRARQSMAIKVGDPTLRAGTQKALTEATDKYTAYLKLREKQMTDPAFYMAASQAFASAKEDAHAVRALTNLLELKVESVPLQRIVARRIQQLGRYELAVGLFDTLLELRPEEPQSYRDLALALIDLAKEEMKQGNATLAAVHAQRAMDLMNEVVMGNWDGRFPMIEVIALTEANQFAALVASWKAKNATAFAEFNNPIDQRLQKNLDADLRVVISWDTDATDIDLWVTEPSEEKAFYSHNRTTIGGAVSNDFTRGYGPEVYYVKKAMEGKYKIQCQFYGSSSQKLTGGTTVSVTLFTNYGRSNQKAQVTTVYLTGQKQVVNLGEIVMGE